MSIIKAQATDAPRQRVSASALQDVTITTLGGSTRTEYGTQPSVTIMLEFPGTAGKLPIRMTPENATKLIARLMQSLSAALDAPLAWAVSARRQEVTPAE